jgi:hypothetical protein
VPAHLLALTLLVACSITALAKGKTVEANRLMSITYGSTSWNTDSTKIDSAYLVLRDKMTGKLVQINLEETEPDSSQFYGSFSINIGENDKITPEIFVPPSNIRNSDKDNRKLYEQIQNNKLPRKPVIWKKDDRGRATLEVYDTRNQAESALKSYQNQIAASKGVQAARGLKPLPSENANLVAQQLERQLVLKKLAMEAAKQESERIRLEQIERQKTEERLKAAMAATEKERAERKARAEKLAAEAMTHFNQGKFLEAQAKFEEAVNLDPQNKSYYFKYGVSLYKNEKFNDALVALQLAEVEPKSENERNYFMGLTHYRLKELPAALDIFTGVAKSGNMALAPSSEFYRGVIFYTQERWEPAKASFETVIDTSTDPLMDQQAEEYIENIANAIATQKLRENKFTFMGSVGAMYDSNVLLAPDNASDQGSNTNIADFRLLTIGDLEYRPVYTDVHELFLKANAGLTNSLKDKSAPADPYLFSLAAPYSYKGSLAKKALKFTVKPGYELMYMAPSGSGKKDLSLNSYFILLDTTIIMNPTWFANYNFEYRGDDSQLASSVGPENADSIRYSLRTNQTFFLDKGRKKALSGSLGYVLNPAEGKNRRYNRLEGGVSFAQPWKWETNWNVGLSVFSLKFPDASNSRSDFNLSLTSGLTKPVKEWLLWGISGAYTKNDSNVKTQEYSKFTVMTTATFITNF